MAVIQASSLLGRPPLCPARRGRLSVLGRPALAEPEPPAWNVFPLVALPCKAATAGPGRLECELWGLCNLMSLSITSQPRQGSGGHPAGGARLPHSAGPILVSSAAALPTFRSQAPKLWVKLT